MLRSPSTDDESNPARKERTARGRERWVINKLRALGSWYTKGLENGSHLRTAINQCDSIAALRDLISEFFFESDLPKLKLGPTYDDAIRA
jgi:tRNA-dihydrouridine synthase